MSRSSWLYGCVLFACALALGATAHVRRLGVRVEERPEQDAWTVRYEASAPVRGFLFPRGLEPSRAGRWRLRGAERARWVRLHGREAVLFEGPPARQVTLELPTDTSLASGDYLFNAAFSDGSRLLYTGHLAVEPLACPGEPDCAAEELRSTRVATRWEFRTSRDRGIRVLHRSRRGRLAWTPPATLVPENGTYVYFGNIEPRSSERVTAVVDPGLPAWIADLAVGFLPELFDLYAERLGVELEFHPLVLLSLMEPGTPGLVPTGATNKGGTLDGLIQIALGGDGWTRDDPVAVDALRTHLAHEAFHLWNGQTFHRRLGRSDRWLSEGSAVYVAAVALRELGFLDDAGFEQLALRNANRCIVAGLATPLVDAAADDAAIYPCGATLQLLADREIARATGGERDLADLFGAMFRAALAADRAYTRFDFLEELHVLVGDPRATVTIERVLHSGIDGPADEFVRDSLAAVGLDVRLVAAADAPFDPKIHEGLPDPSATRLIAPAPAP